MDSPSTGKTPTREVPRSLSGKNITTSERARKLNEDRWNKVREARALGGDPLGTKKKLDKALSRTQIDELYLVRAFAKPWDNHYKDVIRRLKRQYVVAGVPSAQYLILCRRVAALDTLVMQLETAPKPDRYLVLKYGDQLRDFIGQLQRYTEAEKREIVVQETVLVQTLTKVIAVADSTISDPLMRSAFLRALRLQIGDETAREVEQLASPTVIDSVGKTIPKEDVKEADANGKTSE